MAMGHLPGLLARQSRAVGNWSPAQGLKGLGDNMGSWDVDKVGHKACPESQFYFSMTTVDYSN